MVTLLHLFHSGVDPLIHAIIDVRHRVRTWRVDTAVERDHGQPRTRIVHHLGVMRRARPQRGGPDCAELAVPPGFRSVECYSLRFGDQARWTPDAARIPSPVRTHRPT